MDQCPALSGAWGIFILRGGMSDKIASSRGPTNPSGETGTWSDGAGVAPLHKANEIVVTDGKHIDPATDPTTISFKSGREGDVIAVPYPEARYWTKFGRGLRTALVQPTILFDAGFAITADGSASFIQVT
jgi:hypothetical protein